MTDNTIAVSTSPPVSTMTVDVPTPMGSQTVTVFTETIPIVTISDFIRMGDLWLNSISIMLVIFTLFAATMGVFATIFGWNRYHDYLKWRDNFEIKWRDNAEIQLRVFAEQAVAKEMGKYNKAASNPSMSFPRHFRFQQNQGETR